MINCQFHPYKACTFLNTNSLSLQCAECIQPTEYDQQQGYIDIDRITYIANSIIEQPTNRKQKQSDLGRTWQELEMKLQEYFDESFALLEQHHKNILTQARMVFQQLEQQNDNRRQSQVKLIQAERQIQDLLESIDRRASIPEYINSIKELEGVLGQVDLTESNDLGLELQTKANQQMKNLNQQLNKFISLLRSQFDQLQLRDQSLEVDQARSDKPQNSYQGRSSKQRMTFRQIVQKELKCSFNTSEQIMCLCNFMNLVLVGGQDGTLHAYDNDSWEKNWQLHPHDQAIRTIQYDGEQHVATGSNDMNIKLFKKSFDEDEALFQLTEASTLQGHHAAIIEILLFNPILYSGSADNTVRIWNYIQSEAIMSFTGHQMDVNCLAFSPLGYICSGSKDKTVRIWETKNFFACRPTLKLTGHTDSVTGIVSIPEQPMQILSSSLDRTLRLWDIARAVLLKTIKSQTMLGRMRLLQSGQAVVIGYDNSIQIWDYNISACVHVIKTKFKPTFLEITEDGALISIENKYINIYY